MGRVTDDVMSLSVSAQNQIKVDGAVSPMNVPGAPQIAFDVEKGTHHGISGQICFDTSCGIDEGFVCGPNGRGFVQRGSLAHMEATGIHGRKCLRHVRGTVAQIAAKGHDELKWSTQI